MNMATKLLSYYITGTVTIGSMRKYVQLYDAKIYDYKKDTGRPMLFGSKAAILSTSTLLAPCLAPIWLVKDLNRLDAYLRNIDISKSSKSYCEFDYIFK